MKNLKLLDVVLVKDTSLAEVQRICWDTDARTLYCASSSALYSCDASTRQVERLASLTEDDYMPADGSGQVVAMHFHSFSNTLCLACSNGNLLVWNIAMREMECVGMVETGLTAMAWSPDLEMLVLATGHETLILMNQEFETIIEVSQHPSDLGQAEPVTVGWGKKETQFHGSEGKSAAKRKAEGLRPAFDWDDKQPRISWSSEGKFFMVSSINPDTGARKLNVWTPEGVHHAVSEPVDGLENSMAWRPSSNKTVSTQMRPNSHDVIFFESNGLRHREFSLLFKPNQVKVRELVWNASGSVLLVWAEEMAKEDSGASPATHVQLWSTGNYHWYLKQSMVFPAEQRVQHLQWDPEQTHTLHLLTSDGQYLQYTWTLTTHHSQGCTAEDLATVAVLDGNQILGTPFRHMVVPPPMSGYSLPLPCNANAVAFAPNPSSNDLAVLLDDSTVAVCRHRPSAVPGEKDKNGFRATCHAPELEGVVRLVAPETLAQFPLCMWHLTWVTSDLFVMCGLDSSSGSPVLCTAQLDVQAGVLSVRSQEALEGPVCAIAVGSSTGSVVVQLDSGSLLRLDLESQSLLPWETKDGRMVSFPCSCPSMALGVLDGEKVVIGLTDRYQLYINDIQVMRDCTSFTVHDEFLLLTTLKHTLRCVSLHTKMTDLSQLSAEKTLPFDESIRRVERGSQLVVAVPCDTRVVLQMPRGNLEGIHPRALVLSAVRKHQDRLEFGKAFRLMKTHRINLNLLYDHSPQAFLAHVKDFIVQVDSVNNINIFLTDLQEEDVTATMYSAAYSGRQSGEKEDQASKVDTVCDAVRLALEQTNKDKFLLSILTAYVRKKTPELENALQLVQDLRGQGDKASAEEALKYLLFLVDVNELYDVALGTYNFDLVLMVAEKSQKDPKEYIPFLNGLRRMEDNYRKFSVDKHLKRYARALVHISKCPEHFKECLALVKTHGLYSAALRLFPVGSKENKELAVSYAEHLLERSKPAEAALMFYRAGDWERALEAYVSCHNWRQAFCMAAQLKYSSAQTTELAYKLAGQLKAVNKNVDAAIVYERYASDMEEAIATLIEGAQWDEAQRLMHAAGRQDFVETHLEPGLVQARDQHQEALAEARAELTQHTHRLNVVRQLKLQQEQEFLEAESRLNTADADLFSDTSSATGDSVSGFSNKSSFSNRSTLVSRTTGHSSRSRRKMEQKKWSLKKGSPFEDFALVAALSKLIERIDSWREEIGTLLRALVQYNMDEEAEALQTNYESLLDLVKKLTPEIWKDGATASTATQPTFGPGSTANSIAQAMQQGAPLQAEEKLDPVLVVPPKLRKEVSWKLQISQPLKK